MKLLNSHDEKITTKLALIRLLSSMRPLMTVTIGATTEAFVTVHAFEDFLVEMRTKVHFQTVVRLRTEYTQMARKRSIIRMSKSYVPSQVRGIMEFIATLEINEKIL